MLSMQYFPDGGLPGDQGSYKIQLRPTTFRELCEMYGVKYKAMRRMLQPYEQLVGKPSGRYYTVKQLQAMVDKLGPPDLWIDPKSIYQWFTRQQVLIELV